MSNDRGEHEITPREGPGPIVRAKSSAAFRAALAPIAPSASQDMAGAGRSIIDALERIEEPDVARAAWHEALRDNPVSAGAIWAAVSACGGRRWAHHFGVLVADLGHAQRLLAHDARSPRTGGPGARLVDQLTPGPRSRFFCAPNSYLEALPREQLFHTVFAEASAYLRRRAHGRDVHGRLLVDAVVAQLVRRWLGLTDNTATAHELLADVSLLTDYAFTPCPSARLRAEATACRARAWQSLGAAPDGPAMRWWRAFGGCIAPVDAQAAVLDTLAELCGPITDATLAILHDWLESGALWLESASLRQRARAERHTALVRAVRATIREVPTPLLVPLRVSRGNPLELAEDSLAVIGIGSVLVAAHASGQPARLPWSSPEHALGSPQEHFAAGLLGALLCCRGIARTGPLQLRFETLDETSVSLEPAQVRRRFFLWRRA